MAASTRPVRCGIIGYGGAFNMGKHHAEFINNSKGMLTAAVCDLDAKRLKIAQEELPGVQTFTSVGQMLKKADIDLAVIITPHNTHAQLAMQCLKAHKHVILEKPFCITTKQALAMTALAKKNELVLTVYHNRRHDGDFLAIMDTINDGLIGDVFHVEAFMGRYSKPRNWWRSDKKISGGAFYDWGAHIVDWTLHICPYDIKSVSGYFHKYVWKHVTNEDHVEAQIRFTNGATANIQLSSIAAVTKPRWRILGTKGAITDGPKGNIKVITRVKDHSAEIIVPFRQTEWEVFYKNLSRHFTSGGELEVTPESATRVIMVLDLAEQSYKKGRELPAPLP